MARWPAETSAELVVYCVCKMLVHIRSRRVCWQEENQEESDI